MDDSGQTLKNVCDVLCVGVEVEWAPEVTNSHFIENRFIQKWVGLGEPELCADEFWPATQDRELYGGIFRLLIG